jgi:hypothetical protein
MKKVQGVKKITVHALVTGGRTLGRSVPLALYRSNQMVIMHAQRFTSG